MLLPKHTTVTMPSFHWKCAIIHMQAASCSDDTSEEAHSRHLSGDIAQAQTPAAEFEGDGLQQTADAAEPEAPMGNCQVRSI